MKCEQLIGRQKKFTVIFESMDFLHRRNFISSPYRSEREKLVAIKRWNVRKFFKLLDKLQDFLENDKCYRLADNYLIAMVFTYFLRASLEPEEYTRQNFFAALYLAYNMEEDEGEYLLKKLERWFDWSTVELKQRRYLLFRRMEYRSAVSRFCCEIVMRSANPEHDVWLRRRHIYHSGVVYGYTLYDDDVEEICPTCEYDDEDDIDY